MTRISKLYVVSSMLAALALSAIGAIAKGGGGNHGGGSDAGKTKVNDLSIKKTSDKASPRYVSKGKHIKSGKLE